MILHAEPFRERSTIYSNLITQCSGIMMLIQVGRSYITDLPLSNGTSHFTVMPA